jgi:hypothetical protein
MGYIVASEPALSGGLGDYLMYSKIIAAVVLSAAFVAPAMAGVTSSHHAVVSAPHGKAVSAPHGAFVGKSKVVTKTH